MSEASAAAKSSSTKLANGAVLTEVLAQQVQVLLEAGNYDGVKLLLRPVQEVDIAEAIGGLPRTLQALAFRLLPKDEAIEVYEYLEPTVQQHRQTAEAVDVELTGILGRQQRVDNRGEGAEQHEQGKMLFHRRCV